MAMYSICIVDKETHFYKLDYQEIAFPTKVKEISNIDFLPY